MTSSPSSSSWQQRCSTAASTRWAVDATTWVAGGGAAAPWAVTAAESRDRTPARNDRCRDSSTPPPPLAPGPPTSTRRSRDVDEPVTAVDDDGAVRERSSSWSDHTINKLSYRTGTARAHHLSAYLGNSCKAVQKMPSVLAIGIWPSRSLKVTGIGAIR